MLGVGGIGLCLNDYKDRFFQAFTDPKDFEGMNDEWPEIICEKIANSCYSHAGDAYNGKSYVYILVNGKTLKEINENAEAFCKSFRDYGIEIYPDDLQRIADIYIF